MRLILNTDGGSRGNPGPGAIGIVISDEKRKIVFELGKCIGKCTNNEAEYSALIEGLKICAEKSAELVDCRLDSELVVKQLNGLYKVKDERMRSLWAEVKKLESSFNRVSYAHVARERNKEADKLVNQALDSLLI